MVEIFIYGTVAFVLSFGMVFTFRRVATRLGLLDRPNSRSSHTKPTVKGGGIVFASVFLLLLLFLYITQEAFRGVTTVILIACPHVLIIGWLDDRFNLPALLRLFLHLMLSLLIVGLLTQGFQKEFTLLFLPPVFWLNLIFSILFISWFTNLYNFMDGADGLAAGTGVVGAVTLSALSLMAGSQALAVVFFVLAGAVAGFLRWNWHPAKLFMGESGSYFLGISFATLALIGKVEYGLSLYPTILVFGLFIVDPTYTLIIRVSRGQNPLVAHQHFAFHKLLKRGWGHREVAILYAGVSLLWLAPLAYASEAFNDYAFIILVVGYIPLLCYVAYVKAGKD